MLVKTLNQLDIHGEPFLRSLIRKQFRLSAGFAAVFLAALLGLPLANYFLPELMATRLFGFTLTWLILGVGFFPAVWVLGWLFIRRSILLEETVVREVESGAQAVGEHPGKAAPAPAGSPSCRNLPQTT